MFLIFSTIITNTLKAQVPSVSTNLNPAPQIANGFTVDFNTSTSRPARDCEEVKFNLSICNVDPIDNVTIQIWVHHDIILSKGVHNLPGYTFVGIEPLFGFHDIYEKKVDFKQTDCDGSNAYVYEFSAYFHILDPMFDIKQNVIVKVIPPISCDCAPDPVSLTFFPDPLTQIGVDNKITLASANNVPFGCNGDKKIINNKLFVTK